MTVYHAKPYLKLVLQKIIEPQPGGIGSEYSQKVKGIFSPTDIS